METSPKEWMRPVFYKIISSCDEKVMGWLREENTVFKILKMVFEPWPVKDREGNAREGQGELELVREN